MTNEELQAELLRRQLEARQQAIQGLVPVGGEATPKADPDTNILEQGMNGVNEGIAGLLGLPVDLAAGAINLGSQSINAAFGADIAQINNPFGGSSSINGLMQSVGSITDRQPETTAQQYVRSIGQEAGASIIPAAGALSRTARRTGDVARFLGLEALSTVGAGTGAQLARDVAPDSPVAEIVAALVGGGLPIVAARALTSGPQAPSIDDLRRQQQTAYGVVEQSGARLSPQARDDIVSRIQGRVAAEGVPEFLPAPVRSAAARIEALPSNAQITDVEDIRRIVGNDIAGAADGQTRRIGVDLKAEFDDFLANLGATDVQAGDPSGIVAELTRGRELTRRIAQSDGLAGDTGAVTRALRRASTSGTGGNEVNAIRQNIRSILDSPSRRRQYSPEHLALMEQIVEGTPATNALRMVGRMSPTSGTLPMMANMGAVGAAGVTGNPLMLAPIGVGAGAKGAAEVLTNRQVRMLDELVRNGAPLDASRMTPAQAATLTGLIASQAAGFE